MKLVEGREILFSIRGVLFPFSSSSWRGEMLISRRREKERVARISDNETINFADTGDVSGGKHERWHDR